jgi:tetratricopeptide (TPR) repeat protein
VKLFTHNLLPVFRLDLITTGCCVSGLRQGWGVLTLAHMRTMIFPARLAAICSVACLLCEPVRAQADGSSGLQGPHSLLARWPVAELEADRAGGTSRFAQEIREFKEVSRSLGAAEAASRWLRLYDKYIRLSRGSSFMLRASEPLPAPELLTSALPDPDAWPELANAVRSRPEKPNDLPELGLRLLAARLVHDGTQEARVRVLISKISLGESHAHFTEHLLELVSALPVEGEGILTSTGRSLERSEARANDNDSYVPTVYIPDIVAVVGRDKATPLVLRAILSPIGTIRFSGNQTERLAAELALNNVSKLQVPRWTLAQGLDRNALFEALEAKFGAPRATTPIGVSLAKNGKGESVRAEYKSALGYYALTLEAEGRGADAISKIRAAGGLSDGDVSSAVRDAAKRGNARIASSLLRRVVTVMPENAVWSTYLSVAAQADESKRALSDLREAIQAEKAQSAAKAKLQEHLVSALLANDKVAEAVDLLRSQIAGASTRSDAAQMKRHWAMVTSLLSIGQALADQTLVHEAGERLENLAQVSSDEDDVDDQVDLLLKARRFAAAERLIGKYISAAKEPDEYRMEQWFGLLLNVYAAAGESKFVLAVADDYAGWSAGDVAQLELRHSAPKDMSFSVAAALARDGRGDEARKILEYRIQQEPNSDRLYALWLQTAPPDPVSFLDQRAKADLYEERPLIWKAELLRQHGRFQEAVTVCQQAIAIDPSDGEQPAGDRLRVYAVLGDAYAALGEQTKAETCRRVISAIRLAERADVCEKAGLLKRAIRDYKRALELFADAYCVQSRLAVQLAEAGRWKEAEEHYRRAYELMPDSFGRVESHCFGCEDAFGPERAQQIAHEVFQRLAKEHPEKPQIRYLLGYLSEEQHKPAQAMEHYRAAVALDPLYLNAWKKISNLESLLYLNLQEREQTALTLLKLDPHGRHARPELSVVRDWRKVWTLLSDAHVDRNVAVYPIRAAAERLKTAPRRDADWESFASWSRNVSRSEFLSGTSEVRLLELALKMQQLSQW